MVHTGIDKGYMFFWWKRVLWFNCNRCIQLPNLFTCAPHNIDYRISYTMKTATCNILVCLFNILIRKYSTFWLKNKFLYNILNYESKNHHMSYMYTVLNIDIHRSVLLYESLIIKPFLRVSVSLKPSKQIQL